MTVCRCCIPLYRLSSITTSIALISFIISNEVLASIPVYRISCIPEHRLKLKDTIVLALTNQKGGCGKTTTTVSLAGGFAKAGCSVAVIDTDPQCNATDSFGLDRDAMTEEGKYTIADAYLAGRPLSEIALPLDDRFEGRLRVAPGHRGLSTVSQRLEAELQAQVASGSASDLDADEIRSEHRQRLRQSIESLRGSVDIVLIDTPPDLGFLMTTALIAADAYVIPVFPSGYDLKGLETLLRTTERVQSRLNPRLRLLGVVIGNFDRQARLDVDIQQMLEGKFGEGVVFRTVISRSVKHREAPVYGRTIFEHAAGQAASTQFGELTKEMLARLNADQAEAAAHG
jgi:chromosome partitioning protein